MTTRLQDPNSACKYSQAAIAKQSVKIAVTCKDNATASSATEGKDGTPTKTHTKTAKISKTSETGNKSNTRKALRKHLKSSKAAVDKPRSKQDNND